MNNKEIKEKAYNRYPVKLESRHKVMDESLTIGYSVDINKEIRDEYIKWLREEKDNFKN